jgi:hypothetical protein
MDFEKMDKKKRNRLGIPFDDYKEERIIYKPTTIKKEAITNCVAFVFKEDAWYLLDATEQ